MNHLGDNFVDKHRSRPKPVIQVLTIELYR